MGKIHDDWKKAKAKAKNVDTDGLFKSNLGEALDKWEAAWEKLKPAIEGKVNANSLTTAEIEAAVKIIHPLVKKVSAIYLRYQEQINKTGVKNKEKFEESTDQKEKAKLRTISNQLADLLRALSTIQEEVPGSLVWLRTRRTTS